MSGRFERWRTALSAVRITPGRVAAVGAAVGAVAILALLLGGGGETKPAPAPAPAHRPPPEPFELPPAPAATNPPPPPAPSAVPGRLVATPTEIALVSGTRGSILVRNAGGTAVALSDLLVAGSGATAEGTCSGEIQPGATCRVDLAAGAAGSGDVVGVGTGGVMFRIPFTVTPVEPAAPPEPDRFTALVEAARADRIAGMMRGAVVDAPAALSASGLSRGPAPASQTAKGAAVATSYGKGFPRVTSSGPVDLSRTVLQDTPIPLVLLRSINSQIAGPVVAMVERDVYGGDGRTVVIPAGSTMHGRYEGMRRGETRLRTEFTRLVRAHDNAQFDLRANPAPGADVMGRVGLVDDLDERVPERYGGALVAGIIDIAGRVIEQRLSGQNTATTSDGRTVVVAGSQANQDAQSIARMLLERNLDLAPVHTIHTGYRFLVAPTVDLWLAMPGERAEETAGGPDQPADAADAGRSTNFPPPQDVGRPRDGVRPAGQPARLQIQGRGGAVDLPPPR